MGMEEIREEAERALARLPRSKRYALVLTEEVWDENGGTAVGGMFVTREILNMRGGDRHIAAVCLSIADELTEDYRVDARVAEPSTSEKVTTFEMRQRMSAA